MNTCKRVFNAIFLLAFFIIAAGINFCHAEKNFQVNNSCPACHFQNSTLVTCQIHFFHLPQLSLLEILKDFESRVDSQAYTISPSSRSPPRV